MSTAGSRRASRREPDEPSSRVRSNAAGTAEVEESRGAADAAYILLDGQATVLSGRTQIATLQRGDIIGEMAFVEGGRRKASVATSGRLRALRLDYDTLTELLAKRPALKDALEAADREHRGNRGS